ncbi:hypothetical protein KGF54_003431 [Candida jiufengensis]|uniref:uncharacterized protein n=1 Tax=Candida jiufengensis TaxID=497108 RepID=UPI0022257AA8|nr:uncharacterized protein KGF54_003431 [Candida jiufengensis]KAI5952564.1 hypothetical protein KGF54_003431 [Candida jiufengensis]
MKPHLIYQIPDSSWYIVITNTSKHFYFNNKDGNSFWQLSNIEEFYKSTIDINNLVSKINFDEVSLLFAKSKGLKVELLEEPEVVTDEIDVQEEDENLDNNQGDEEFVYENDNISIKPVTEEVPKQKNSGILAGYSSSEEEDEEEDEVDEPDKSKEYTNNYEDIVSKVLDQQQVEEESSDNESNNSLDLSLEKEEETVDSTTQFKELLNRYSSQIDYFDPWNLVEEKLSSEFIKSPSYHVIGSTKIKEEIFKQWLYERTDVELEKYNDENLEEYKQITFENLSLPPKLTYLSLFQNSKDDVKSMLWPNYYSKYYKKINSIKLTKSKKEEIFRDFKNFIIDFANSEKQYKKSNPDFKENYKIFKLNEFLNNQNIRRSVDYKIDSKHTLFENWLCLMHYNNISSKIAKNNINFVVGDEKRLNSYIQHLNKLK